MKLALGTVQFGLNYGVSNSHGQVPFAQAQAMLEYAAQHHITTLDTASAYGTSEQVLGEITQQSEFKTQPWQYITKLLPKENITLNEQINQCLKRLQCKQVYALMFHDGAPFYDKKAAEYYQGLLELKQQGYCHKIGVSVYNPEELLYIINHFAIDIVQFPLNIFDQRFIAPNIINLLQQKNIEIHARSLFLQGLLLMDNTQLPNYFSPYKTYFDKLTAFITQQHLSPLQACLSFAKSIPFVDKYVVGSTNLHELKQIVETYQQAQAIDFSTLAVTEQPLINPSNWQTEAAS